MLCVPWADRVAGTRTTSKALLRRWRRTSRGEGFFGKGRMTRRTRKRNLDSLSARGIPRWTLSDWPVYQIVTQPRHQPCSSRQLTREESCPVYQIVLVKQMNFLLTFCRRAVAHKREQDNTTMKCLIFPVRPRYHHGLVTETPVCVSEMAGAETALWQRGNHLDADQHRLGALRATELSRKCSHEVVSSTRDYGTATADV